VARADITVKMVVPMFGALETNWGVRAFMVRPEK
jgi:hypothetical protein